MYAHEKFQANPRRIAEKVVMKTALVKGFRENPHENPFNHSMNHLDGSGASRTPVLPSPVPLDSSSNFLHKSVHFGSFGFCPTVDNPLLPVQLLPRKSECV